jgi:hypothetical protein
MYFFYLLCFLCISVILCEKINTTAGWSGNGVDLCTSYSDCDTCLRHSCGWCNTGCSSIETFSCIYNWRDCPDPTRAPTRAPSRAPSTAPTFSVPGHLYFQKTITSSYYGDPVSVWYDGTKTNYFTDGNGCLYYGSLDSTPPTCYTVSAATNLRGIWGYSGFLHVSSTFCYSTSASCVLKCSFSTNTCVVVVSGPYTTSYSPENTVATSSAINNPNGLWVNNANQLFITDSGNHRVCVVGDGSGARLNTYAGNAGRVGFSGDGGSAVKALLNNPLSVWGDNQGKVFIADTNNKRVRVVDTTTLIIDTIYYNDDFVYSIIGDGFGNILFVDPNSIGMLSPGAGNITYSFTSLNGNGFTALFTFPGFVLAAGKSTIQLFNYLPQTVSPSLKPSAAPTFSPSISPSTAPTVNPTAVPSMMPTASPTVIPSVVPSVFPTFTPSVVPTVSPSAFPTFIPTATPTFSPTAIPTLIPTAIPSASPSVNPTVCPTLIPSVIPTFFPSFSPSQTPTTWPTVFPTVAPSVVPSFIPTADPTQAPSTVPSVEPTVSPSFVPTASPTLTPSMSPTQIPSVRPTIFPTMTPTAVPTKVPTAAPSYDPTLIPTAAPTDLPTAAPSFNPTVTRTTFPTAVPTAVPSEIPTISPSAVPTESPTYVPSRCPSVQPSLLPTVIPTVVPTRDPTYSPTRLPTVIPSEIPTVIPSERPSVFPGFVSFMPTISLSPSVEPTLFPTATPSFYPSGIPSSFPSVLPSYVPSGHPSSGPSPKPTPEPTVCPTVHPTVSPTFSPSDEPSAAPTASPTVLPTFYPSAAPSALPTVFPTVLPTEIPTQRPSSTPSRSPGVAPTVLPSVLPSQTPTASPTSTPTEIPSSSPSTTPSGRPSVVPSSKPSGHPTDVPASFPSGFPTCFPTDFPVSAPSTFPSSVPAPEPTVPPTVTPTAIPTYSPTESPTLHPSMVPSLSPSAVPTADPTMSPTKTPSAVPTVSPSATPSETPSQLPTESPSFAPTLIPSTFPTVSPTELPSVFPTITPSDKPSVVPSFVPTATPTFTVTAVPSLATDISLPDPVVVINLARTLGQCSPLILDLTGSVGKGDQGWSSYSIIASTSSTNVTALIALNKFFRTSYKFSPPSPVPASFFEIGESYAFQVTLCNYLRKCGFASTSIKKVSSSVPTVTIDGSNSRVMRILDSVSLSSSAIVSSCEGNSVMNPLGLLFRWTVADASGSILSYLSSSSRDPTRFVLPSYSLAVNSFYKITMTATYNGVSSSASVQISTIPGSVVAVISGGANQVAKVGSPVSIDGSKSYDEDQKSAFGVFAGLSYNWTCSQLSPSRMNHCHNIFDATAFQSQSNLEAMSLTILSSLSSLLTSSTSVTAQISLTVTDMSSIINQRRTARTTSLLTILPGTSATISLSSNGIKGRNIINPSSNLLLTGVVAVPSIFAANLTWSSVAGSSSVGIYTSVIDLTKAALTTLTSRYASSLASQLINFNLKLDSNVLTGGFTYSFLLSCSLSRPGIASSLAIDIMVNAPPTPGSFLVDPVEGEELLTFFSFACNSWRDENLPLQYQFDYLSPTSGSSLTIKSLSEVTYMNSITLPAGSSLSNRKIITIAKIIDSYGANNSATVTVKVTPSSLLSSSSSSSNSSKALAAFFNNTQQAFKTTNVDAIKQAANLNSYLLNRIDCSLAPNCTALNREACFSTPQTCGSCLSSSFLGAISDSNDGCYRNEAERAAALNSVEGRKNKTCTANCSNHGKCQFIQISTNAKVSSCAINDNSCVAVCQCDPDYDIPSSDSSSSSGIFGLLSSSICDVSKAQLATKITYRDNVIQGIATMTSVENPSGSSVGGWIDYLTEATHKTNEISVSSGNTVLRLVKNITNTVNAEGISSQSMMNSLKILDSIARTVTNTTRRTSSSNHRRLEEVSSTSTEGEGLVDFLQTVGGYAATVVSSLVSGELPVNQETDKIKLTMQTITLKKKETLPSSAATLISSLSSLSSSCDIYHDVTLPNNGGTVSLPACSNEDSSKDVAIAAYSIASSLYSHQSQAGSYDSNPLSLYLSQYPCDTTTGEDHCKMTVVLKRNPSTTLSSFVAKLATAAADAAATTIGMTSSHNTTCLKDDYSSHFFLCPNGLNYTVSCNGTAQIIHSHCPVFITLPTCKLMNDQYGNSFSSCTMIRYTEETVTCSCSLADAVEGRRRRLVGNSTFSSSEITVSYVSMLETIVKKFEDTVISADSLSTEKIAKGYQAILVIGMLSAAIIIAMIYSYHADKQAKKVDTMETKKIDEAFLKPNLRMKSSTVTPSLTISVSSATRVSSSLIPSSQTNSLMIVEGQDISQLAEEALPTILQSSSSSRSWKSKFFDELKRHHRWLGIIFFYSEKFPRILRVLSLSNNIILMLFVQSLTYSMNHSNDGSCKRLNNETDCLQPRSGYATGSSKCYWTPPSSTTSQTSEGTCDFIQPNDSIEVILFVAVFSAIVSTPLAILVDWIIIHILAAPDLTEAEVTAEKNKKKNISKISDVNSFAAILPSSSAGAALSKEQSSLSLEKRSMPSLLNRFTLTRSFTMLIQKGKNRTIEEELEYAEVKQQFNLLTKELKEYRFEIVDPKEQKEFDGRFCVVNTLFTFLLLLCRFFLCAVFSCMLSFLGRFLSLCYRILPASFFFRYQ